MRLGCTSLDLIGSAPQRTETARIGMLDALSNPIATGAEFVIRFTMKLEKEEARAKTPKC